MPERCDSREGSRGWRPATTPRCGCRSRATAASAIGRRRRSRPPWLTRGADRSWSLPPIAARRRIRATRARKTTCRTRSRRWRATSCSSSSAWARARRPAATSLRWGHCEPHSGRFVRPVVESLQTDVLSLGGGGAGLCAALHAADRSPSLSVTVVVKGLLGRAGCTRMVQGGYNAVLASPDSLDAHLLDTLAGGGWINDQELVWTLVNEAPGRVLEVESRSACLFDRTPAGRI